MTPSESTPDERSTDVTTPVTPDGRLDRRGQRNQWIVIVVLSLAVLYVVYQQVQANIAANVATSTAKDLAEPVDKLCRDDPNARRRIGNERCDQAAEVQQDPPVAAVPRDGKDGKPGKDGKDGRGIAGTAIVNGHLFVTYTDGIREDKGVIVTNGKDGRGIRSATLRDGQLVLTYTDDTSTTVGRIVGRDGVNGRGIADVTVSEDYRVIVTYTDGTIDDVGALPPGPPGNDGTDGADGRGIDTVDFNIKECTATIRYSDGTAETKTMTGCEPSPPTQPTTTTTGILPTS